jgi:hypothetical protein
MGVLWLAFGAIVYWYAGIHPIVETIKELAKPGSSQTVLSYLNTSGVTFMLGVVVLGIIIYIIRDIQNRANGVDLSLLYKTVPPD